MFFSRLACERMPPSESQLCFRVNCKGFVCVCVFVEGGRDVFKTLDYSVVLLFLLRSTCLFRESVLKGWC